MVLWIALSLAGLSLLTLCVIIFRHWREIRLLDPGSIQEERERQKRDELMLQRFERMRLEKFGPFRQLFKRAIFLVKTAYHAVYLKLVRLEKFYRQAKSPFSAVAPSAKERIKLLLDDGRSLVRDMKCADAERRFLEVLTLDSRNLDAYKGLGGIYLKQKLYPQAKETFEFLLKLNKADDIVFASLAEIAGSENKPEVEEAMRLKAVESRPRLANRQAELADFYLKGEKPQQAWPYAKRATELDPKSAKYLELSVEIAILLGDRTEARKRYDKLRLVCEDRSKLQAIKDKMDAIPVKEKGKSKEKIGA